MIQLWASLIWCDLPIDGPIWLRAVESAVMACWYLDTLLVLTLVVVFFEKGWTGLQEELEDVGVHAEGKAKSRAIVHKD